ncbi:MAG: hypothetical protein Q8Q01_05120 [archaeon]|nr:hypothetical protein [archaeon]
MDTIKRVGLAFLLTLGCGATQEKPLSKSEREIQFGQCLAEKAVMYGASWCMPCKEQKKTLGEGWNYLKHKYVDCDGTEVEEQLCDDKDIKYFPTWEIDETFYEGYQTIEELSQFSGCKY